MATTFSDFLHVMDTAMAVARDLDRRIDRLTDSPHLPPSILGAIEQKAEEAHELAATPSFRSRPRDVIDEEWNDTTTAFARNRMESFALIAGQRPADKQEWIRELQLASREYLDAWRDFDRATER